ncbi:hypothetical protein ADICEAN_01968 [Cesiribacter andamanensis AMV16]|uniref:Uncharacterized protein n=2 Tax=Cesiribacter TaxID=1133570 RepID=M7NWQ0_9BACT|nr:hypothetical protein ADICEAN_01968 [Cesiribacter andamanensis AMV16]
MLLLAAAPRLQAQEGERRMQEKSPDSQVTKLEDVKRSPFRGILNRITLGGSVGYGMNHYRQRIPGSVVRQGTQHYLLSDGSPAGYQHWLNQPRFNPLVVPGDADEQVRGDTTALRMTGMGNSLPLSLDVHVVLADRFRLGGGLGFELFSINNLDFKNDGELLQQYQSSVKTAMAWRWYGMAGARIIRWQYWDHTVDFRLGKKNFLSKFDQAAVNEGLFYNLGVTMERHYSEYFRFTFRPSLEWHSFTTSTGDLPELKTNVPSLYLQAGISINYPRLPRCPMNGCQTQLEHVHYGKEFRGQPLHRWQNPKYGQNHPELQRNLRRRKDDTEQQLQKRPKRRQGFLWFR